MKKRGWMGLLILLLVFMTGQAQAGELGDQEVLRNEYLALSINENATEIRLTDLQTGRVWHSSVQDDQIPEGERVNKTWVKRSHSLMLINYTDAEANTGEVKTTDLISQEPVTRISAEDGACMVNYDFLDLQLAVRLEFRLEEHSLLVKIPDESLKEEGVNRWVSILLMPFFGCSTDADEGYFLYPSGCGELFHFKEQRYRSNAMVSMTLPVYAPHITQRSGFPLGSEGATLGEDMTVTAMLPAYGIRKNGAGLAAVVEEGDADCDLVVSPAGVSLPVNRIYPKLIYRMNYGVRGQEVNVAGATEFSYTSLLVDRDLRRGDRTVRYLILKDQEADYAGMAAAVRESYLKRDILQTGNPAPEMVTDFLIGVEEQQVLSKNLLTLTTFEQAEEMLNQLCEAGYTDLILNLKGWNQRGVLGYPNYDTVSGDAGGKDALRHLLQVCNERNVSLQLQLNGVKLREDNRGFVPLSDAARDGNIYPYTLVTRNHTYYLQNSSFRNRLLQKAREMTATAGGAGLTLEDIGGYLYDDFSDPKAMRADLARQWREALTAADAVIGGNAYLWGKVTLLREIPDESKLTYFGDTSVPFFQMVVHGCINYTGQPVNLFYDSKGQLLRMMEYGFVPCFELTWDHTTQLMNTEYNLLFSGKFATWEKHMEEMQTCFREYRELTSGKTFTEHDEIASGVWRSRYEDAIIYVNYSDEACAVPEGVVEGHGYLMARKEGAEP